nr:40S ribosomal protein S27-2 [Elaeis guineensis]
MDQSPLIKLNEPSKHSPTTNHLSKLGFYPSPSLLVSLPQLRFQGSLPSDPITFYEMVLPNDIDLLNPPAELEKKRHKLKRLVQSPNSFFMDVKCQGCFNITTVFSHSQTVVVCGNCQTVLCQPTGGRARLTEGCSFRRKGD